MAHLTVVPENFDPAADDESSPGEDGDERVDSGESMDRGEPAGSAR